MKNILFQKRPGKSRQSLTLALLALSLIFVTVCPPWTVTAQTDQRAFNSELVRLTRERDAAVAAGRISQAGALNEQLGNLYISNDRITGSAGVYFNQAGDHYASVARDSGTAATKSRNYTLAIRAYTKAKLLYLRMFESTREAGRRRQADAAQARIDEIEREMGQLNLAKNKEIAAEIAALTKPKSEPASEPPPPTGPVTEITLDLAYHTFAVSIPSIFEIDEQTRNTLNQIRSVMQSLELKKANGVTMKNYQMGVNINQLDKEPIALKDCVPNTPFPDVKHEKILINGKIPACLTTTPFRDDRQRPSDPRTVGGSVLVSFTYEKRFYRLQIGISYLDPADESRNKIKAKMEAIARSLRLVEKVKEEPIACSEGDTERVEKGIPFKLVVLDPAKEITIIQQPFLRRPTDVADAVAEYSSVLVQLLDAARQAKQLGAAVAELPIIVQSASRGQIDSEAIAAMRTVGEWHLEQNQIKISFMPVQIEDMSEFQADGPLSTAVLFYLRTLSTASAGVGNLGRKISNQNMNVFYRVHYITIEGVCYPRRICRNGKMVPDRNYLEFEETRRGPGKEQRAVGPLTPSGVEQHLSKLRESIKLWENNYRKFTVKPDERCDDSIVTLLNDFQFPVDK